MKHGWIEIECPICGKKIGGQACDRRIYCSRRCAAVGMSRQATLDRMLLVKRIKDYRIAHPGCSVLDICMNMHISQKYAYRLLKEMYG